MCGDLKGRRSTGGPLESDLSPLVCDLPNPSAFVLRRGQCRALRLYAGLLPPTADLGRALFSHDPDPAVQDSHRLPARLRLHARALSPGKLWATTGEPTVLPRWCGDRRNCRHRCADSIDPVICGSACGFRDKSRRSVVWSRVFGPKRRNWCLGSSRWLLPYIM